MVGDIAIFKLHRLSFKIVSEIQIKGNYQDYRPMMRARNFALSFTVGSILVLTIILMGLLLVLDN
jgi:hypothetical protein